MNRQFETPEPIDLYVEIGKGKVEIRATSDRHHRPSTSRAGTPTRSR